MTTKKLPCCHPERQRRISAKRWIFFFRERVWVRVPRCASASDAQVTRERGGRGQHDRCPRGRVAARSRRIPPRASSLRPLPPVPRLLQVSLHHPVQAIAEHRRLSCDRSPFHRGHRPARPSARSRAPRAPAQRTPARRHKVGWTRLNRTDRTGALVFERGEAIALQESDPVGVSMAPRVVCGNLKRHFRYIQRDDSCRGRVRSDRNCDSARPRAEVENPRGRAFAQKIQCGFDHGLGLGTRDQHALAHHELQRKEFAEPRI